MSLNNPMFNMLVVVGIIVFVGWAAVRIMGINFDRRYPPQDREDH
jgi:hypothetical protein